MRKLENIGGTWLFISIILFICSHFIWGMFPENVVTMLYYISFLNVAMISGLLLMFVSKGDILHFVGTGMFCIFSWMLSMEFFGKPTDWSDWNIATFIVDGIASIFISIRLKKFKNAVG